MNIVENNLKKLASHFPAKSPLYAVGGYVRDTLLNLECHDVDLCSELTVEEVKTLLSNTGFEVSDKNLRVGTVLIKARGFNAEYTTFRTDSYPDSGKHQPLGVSFTKDIFLDAKRRDFTCNALYRDIAKDQIIDLLNSKNDIENKVLKTVDNPDKVFSEDGLRILRLVRFAAELGFEIDSETFNAAKRNVNLVKDISTERILVELDKIFVSDTAHPELTLIDAHFRGIKLLVELGLDEILLPELAALKGLEQNVKYHIYDAFDHSLECFRFAPKQIRWAALLHDVGKRPCFDKNGNMYGHDSVGAEMVSSRLAMLKFPKARAKRIVDLVAAHMVNISGNMSMSKLRWFIAERAHIALDLADLKDADAKASSGYPLEENFVRNVYNDLIFEGAPLSIRELNVGGEDLIKMGVKEEFRGMILYQLWRETIMNPVLRDREKAMEYLKKKGEKL